jgi:hypothetical protein
MCDGLPTGVRATGAIVAAVALCLCVSFDSLLEAGEAKGSAGPVLISPVDGDNIPRPERDTNCAPDRPCRQIGVVGRVPVGHVPVLVVAPLMAAPRMWVQPRVVAKRPDGTFDAMVYLGNAREGVGEKFSIYVLACADQKLTEGEIVTGLPGDCAASPPVTVLRTR